MALPDVIRNGRSELVDAVRSGLPYANLAELRDALGLSTDAFAEILGIPRRALGRRKSEGAFTSVERNAIRRVARVYRGTVAFFEDEASANGWLAERRSCGLEFSSRVILEESNLLLDPSHPDVPRVEHETTPLSIDRVS